MKIKKIGSIILALVMVLTLFSGAFTNLTASAAEKQMLKLGIGANASKIGIGVDKGSITEGNYTVRFKYNFEKGDLYYDYKGTDYQNAVDGAIFAVYSHTGTGQSRMAYLRVRGLSGDYDYTSIDDYTVEYTFSISQGEIDACQSEFYLGFVSKGSVELYIADMVMYKTDDVNKANLLPEAPTAANWRFYSTWNETGLPSGSAYMDYDETYFPEKKYMVKLGIGENAPKVGIGVAKDKITEGRYTVRFKYNFVKGDLYFDYRGDDYKSASDGAIFAVYSHLADTGANRMAYFSVRGLSGDYDYTIVDSSTVEYYFNITQADIDACLSEFYLGFVSTVGSPELYVADMVMYKSNDENKTNLLPENQTADNWRHYTTYNIAGLPSGSAYMDYDESLFTEIEIVYGDGNADGYKDILDLVDLNREIGAETFKANYDLNKDGQLTEEDCLILRRHILGIELIA